MINVSTAKDKGSKVNKRRRAGRAVAAAGLGVGLITASASPAQAVETIYGHNVSEEEYRAVTEDRCGPPPRWSWQENACHREHRDDLFRTHQAPIGVSYQGVSVESVPLAYTTTSLDANQMRDGTLVSLSFDVNRGVGPEICHWRVDLSYYNNHQRGAYLVDRGPEMAGPDDCISWRDGGSRNALPQMIPQPGRVCATLYAYGQKRPERDCVPVFAPW